MLPSPPSEERPAPELSVGNDPSVVSVVSELPVSSVPEPVVFVAKFGGVADEPSLPSLPSLLSSSVLSSPPEVSVVLSEPLPLVPLIALASKEGPTSMYVPPSGSPRPTSCANWVRLKPVRSVSVVTNDWLLNCAGWLYRRNT